MPAKKEAARKKDTKPKASKRSKRIHKDIPIEHHFLLIDGSTVQGLEDLADAFERMSDDVFFYHVDEFKNDFANWVKDIFDEKDLAEHLALAKTLEHAHIAVLKHVIKQLKRL